MTYFSIHKDRLIKTYSNGKIVQFDKYNGKILNEFQDKVSENQHLYDYDFENVRYTLFFQYPIVYSNLMLFANSKGELKAVDMATKKIKSSHQTAHPVFSSPKILSNRLYVNFGREIISFNPLTGKVINRFSFDDVALDEPVIDGDAIYLLTERGSLFCLNSNLNCIWNYQVPLKDTGFNKIVISGNQLLFGSNVMYCLDKTSGKLQWNLTLSNSKTSPFFIEPSNECYVVNNDAVLMKINYKGIIKRIRKIKNRKIVAGVKHCNKVLIFTCDDGVLYKMDENFENDQPIFKELVNNKIKLKDTYIVTE